MSPLFYPYKDNRGNLDGGHPCMSPLFYPYKDNRGKKSKYVAPF